MNTHILLLLLTGIALMGVFFLPRLLKRRMLTVPIIFVGFGALVFSLPVALPFINPEDSGLDRYMLEHLSELIVIISLAAIGIKIDRKPSSNNWRAGLLLLGIAMPLTIAAMAILGYQMMGLPLATALLLGAVLAPTDPVLADNVQVGPPNQEPEGEMKFALTLEAGLNDGLAFPFVYLAIGLVGVNDIWPAVATWAWWDLGYRLIVGLVVGGLIGKLLSYLFFRFVQSGQSEQSTDIKEGIFVLASVLITYALTEIVEGYGFLAVFVAAVISRRHQPDSDIHTRKYQAIDQVEQALLATFLIVFGGILVQGGLADLTWRGAVLALLLVFVIRPVSGMLSVLDCRLDARERVAVSWFGIRGIGSIYYLAYAHNQHADWPMIDTVWSVVNFTILVSLILHGVSVKPVLEWVERATPTQN